MNPGGQRSEGGRQRKTDRVRGKIYRLVRATALAREKVSVDDFPSLTGVQAGQALNQLAQRGELARVHRGHPGSWGGIDRSVFAATDRLRAPELTNQRLSS
jgi:hypothetical protein